MDSSQLFSIIIPTYNAEKDIEKCLESICSQVFLNFEVIIVDGKSLDSTLEIIKKYINKLENLMWVSEPDDGIYDAMNKGIRMATGKYLIFMGSDDSFYNGSVLLQISKIVTIKKVDVVYGNVFSKIFNGIYDGEFTYSKLRKKNICHQAIFLKKTVFDRIGVFDLKYKMCADYDHNIRWFFSSEITRCYTNLIITNYGDMGFSSFNQDLNFNNDKNLKFIKHGIGKLTVSELLELINNEKNRMLNIFKRRLVKIYKCK